MTTKHIKQYSFSDEQIEKIYIDSEGLKIQYKQWDENRVELIFSEYRGL